MLRKKVWGTAHPFFEGGLVFGRKSANASFLTALLQADPFPAYHFFLSSPASKTFLEQALQERFPHVWEQGKIHLLSRNALPAALAQHSYACFHLSDWVGSFVDVAIARNRFSQELFPITAPVHTLSYAHYGAAFLKHMWGGVSPRDVIVATSTATVDVIQGYFRQLRAEYGLAEANFAAPAIQHIPLGVDASQFAAPEEKELLRTDFRQEHGIGEHTPIFLSFSRVSYLSKMDFLPILDAFRRAEALGLERGIYHFILAGRMDAGDPFGPAIVALAKKYGISFSLLQFPDTPDDAKRKALFAAADVFLSPVDNIQETFGLTILEALAAELPVIASAIDGYKDLVEPGVTGFLVPTIGPASAQGSTAEAAVVAQELYHLFLAQQTVVQLGPFAEALYRLGTNASLRKEMGQKGRQRVLKHHTWEKVLEQYLSLWEGLSSQPLPQEAEGRIRGAHHPALPRFTEIFGGYFTQQANSPALQETLVRLTPRGQALQQGTDPLVVYALVTSRVERERLNALLAQAIEPVPFGVLAAAFAAGSPKQDKDFLLLWALKHDFLELVEG